MIRRRLMWRIDNMPLAKNPQERWP